MDSTRALADESKHRIGRINLREVFPYYEFDMPQGIVKYRKLETDVWTEYKPLPAEME